MPRKECPPSIRSDHDESAVPMSAEELADLDEAAALADYRRRQAAGTVVTVPHRHARTVLGLTRE